MKIIDKKEFLDFLKGENPNFYYVFIEFFIYKMKSENLRYRVEIIYNINVGFIDIDNINSDVLDVIHDFIAYILNKREYFLENLNNYSNLYPLFKKMFNQFLINKSISKKDYNSVLFQNVKSVLKEMSKISKIKNRGTDYYCYNSEVFRISTRDIEKIKKKIYNPNFNITDKKDIKKQVINIFEYNDGCLTFNDIFHCLYSKYYEKMDYLPDDCDYTNKIQIEEYINSLNEQEFTLFKLLEEFKDYKYICKKLDISKSQFYQKKKELEEKFNEYFNSE
jgi:hypothetical protein